MTASKIIFINTVVFSLFYLHFEIICITIALSYNTMQLKYDYARETHNTELFSFITILFNLIDGHKGASNIKNSL